MVSASKRNTLVLLSIEMSAIDFLVVISIYDEQMTFSRPINTLLNNKPKIHC